MTPPPPTDSTRDSAPRWRPSEPRVPRSLALVLAYELLFGAGIELEEHQHAGSIAGKKRSGQSTQQPWEERAMLRADKALRTALRSVLKENGAKDAEGYFTVATRRVGPGGGPPRTSRHVRVNTLKLSTDEAAAQVGELRAATGPARL